MANPNSTAPKNCNMIVKDDILTITIDLNKRYGQTKGSIKKGKKSIQLISSCFGLFHLPSETPGEFRDETLQLFVTVPEPPPPEITTAILQRLRKDKKKQKECDPVELREAIIESLEGYPKRLKTLIDSIFAIEPPPPQITTPRGNPNWKTQTNPGQINPEG